jgi:uncharacterized membrane protein HdeD (DUF308 family)
MWTPTSLVLRGIVGILFGILTFAWPGLTLSVLAILFAVYALLDGIANIAHAIQRRGEHAGARWLMALQGIVGILAAAVTVFWPGLTIYAFVMVVGAWALVTGIFEVVAAIRLRNVLEGDWMLGLSGVLSIILGFMLFAYPMSGAVVLAWWVGAYAFVAGILLISLGFRTRGMDMSGYHVKHA